MTTAAGCKDSLTRTVTVNTLPTVSASSSATGTVCAGSQVILTGSGASTYTWSPAGGVLSASGATDTIAPAATTTYTVTGTDGNGCKNTATVAVSVNPLPVLSVTPATSTATAICAGDSVILAVSGASTYTWSPNGSLTPSSGATVVARPAITTTYAVTGTDLNGCSSTVNKTVTVNQLPTVTITPAAPTAICFGTNVVLSGNGAATYTWTPAGGGLSASGATDTVSPATNTTYTVIGTDINGCRNTATRLVTVNALPTVAISPATPAPICNGQSTTLTASGASTYSWAPSGSLSSGTTATVTATPTVTTTYTVTGTDGNGCRNTATKVVTVNPRPTITVTPAVAGVCAGAPVGLKATGASTYRWSPATGLSATTGDSVTASPFLTTIYTVAGTDVNGCTDSVRKTVNVAPLPTIAITPSTATICSGKSITLRATGGVTYSWSPTATLSTIAADSAVASPTTTTVYTVSGTDANGCTNTATRTVNVLTTPTISISPAVAMICNGQNILLTASGASTYSWTPTGTLSSGTAAAVTATPTSTTTYTVTGTATNGCVAQAIRVVTVNQRPVVTASGASAVCAGLSTVLTAGGASTYTWRPTGGVLSTGGVTYTVSPAALTTYTVVGTDINGCKDSTTKTVAVNALPSVSISPSTPIVICNGQSAVLVASGAVTYGWSPSGSLSSAAAPAVVATPGTTTTYTVTGTDLNGCRNTASKTITVNPLPVISISPATAVAVCAGAGATLRASGAVSYSWRPATGLTASTGDSVVASPAATTIYTVRGTDANGCTDSASRTVTVLGLPTLVLSPSSNPTICEGSSVMLVAAGTSVSYVWSPSSSLSSSTGSNVIASPVVTTTYTVTGTAANGCQSTGTKTVNVNPKPATTITPAGYLRVCGGDTVRLRGPSGYDQYQWLLYGSPVSGGTDSLLATVTGGFYTLRVTNLTTNCVGTTTVPTVINVTPRPVAVVQASGATLSTSIPFQSYQWMKNGVPIAGATSRSYTASHDGYYSVMVTDTGSLHCTGTSESYRLTALGISTATPGGAEIRIYPNPAADLLHVDAPAGTSVLVVAMDGKTVFSGADVREINIGAWPDGVYRVVLHDKGGTYLKTEKISKLTR